jgi:hypothetical protein
MLNHGALPIGFPLEGCTHPDLFRSAPHTGRSAGYGIYLSAGEHPKLNERSRQLFPSI